jgi:hypothetical protein
LPGGIVEIGGDSSVDSDVEEIVKWDRDLHATKTFSTAVMILSDRKYNFPKLDVQLKNFLILLTSRGSITSGLAPRRQWPSKS